MKHLLPLLFAAVFLVLGATTVRADINDPGPIVILKWSVPVFSTRYEVVNADADPNDLNDANGDGKPYPRKTVSFTETWSYYDIHNVDTGELISIDYYTWYNIGATAFKRYIVGDIETTARFLTRSNFYRAPSSNSAPTYNFALAFNDAFAFGDPDTETELGYAQFWDSLKKGAQPITTVIPAKITPPTAPAVRVLLPSGAIGAHQGFRQELIYAAPPGSPATISPNNIRYTLEKGTTTLNYDSVLTGKANKLLAPNVHVFNHDGVEVFPRTLAYGVKVVRDALETLGYEVPSDLDANP